MPNLAQAGILVETAAKWFGTASSPSVSAIQSRAEPALVMVSSVVKVLDATMNSVVFGFRRFSTSWIWAPSTLET
ncbi:hypothetical protein D3C86_1943470 [compost metagenome]